MTRTYRIFGSELSPYSVKVRSYFRYKGIPHDWVLRNQQNQEEFKRHAKLPLIPLVITPDGEGIQDSTPIIEQMEERHPEPSVHPDDPVARFVSFLLEEYADEWANKPMFHYRWSYEADQAATAERIARQMIGGIGDPPKDAVEEIRRRMVDRLHFVGSSAETRPIIEGSFHRVLGLLEAHLTERPYLFGQRPALGDFGLAAELYECASDPTPGAIMRERAPAVAAWCERMLKPVMEGPFEDWATLRSGLEPLLRDEVGALFLPWSDANARALEAGNKQVELTLENRPYRQAPQKYHARSLAVLRR
ncbi:MAG TPA: glutathione S-transferase family protein, partial [Alphaproteobacteria bacterium]|nr:glutathione S-transferase family protein [Alphaproteobacteria bacterium]